ncbi:FH protein interacting protein FIP2 [Hibiscus syriacus]|uniref:FH protein interacting protein FIP2 n=1 Tax=Hibiscus syriacus TaxID=106335 RepID=A0A6A2Z6V8_HIBSY|nr:FH protein interacting protein FIP2 [Hibiscus syriacus]
MKDSDLSSLIRLNIGGKKYFTTIDILTRREPDSMLAAMFSGRHTVCYDAEKGLIEGINSVLNKRKEEDLCAELMRIDIIKCIQSERFRFRGVNLSGLDLSKLDLSYVDFSFACLKNVFFS